MAAGNSGSVSALRPLEPGRPGLEDPPNDSRQLAAGLHPEPTPEDYVLGNQRRQLLPADRNLGLVVRKVSQPLAIPRDGKLWLISDGRPAGHGTADQAGLRFEKIPLTFLNILDPCVSDFVTSALSEDNTSVNSHCEQLTPCPQGEILAVAGSALLEFFRRLPVVFLAKQFPVIDIATGAQELANVLPVAALDG